MRVGSGNLMYHWIDHWGSSVMRQEVGAGWAHHGIVVTGSGDLVTFHPAEPTVLVLDRDGNLLRSWDSGLTEGHGITLVQEGQSEYLWFADNGRKRDPSLGYEYPASAGPVSGRVVKTTLDGQVVMELSPPELPIYEDGHYMPTSVAVNEKRFGGNEDIWVADGYGMSYVHRYDHSGKYLGSINGEEGRAGRFNTPHGIHIDRRKSTPELYIADRSNARVQVYDLEGQFKRSFGSDFLTSPSAFAVYQDSLIIAELRARLTLTDSADRFIGYLGANDQVCRTDGWPNSKDVQGSVAPPNLLESGKFNSPHGLAVDSYGNLYVAEWLIGGRLIKLARE